MWVSKWLPTRPTHAAMMCWRDNHPATTLPSLQNLQDKIQTIMSRAMSSHRCYHPIERGCDKSSLPLGVLEVERELHDNRNARSQGLN